MRDLGLVLAGVLLSWLSQLMNEWRVARKERRAALTKMWQMLESIFVSMEIGDAWRKAQGIETLHEVFDLRVGWRRSIPPRPPEVPDNYDRVAEQISELEAVQGQYGLSKQIALVKSQLELLNDLHVALTNVAEKLDGKDIPERALGVYATYKESLKSLMQSLFRDLAKRRTPVHRRVIKWCAVRISRMKAWYDERRQSPAVDPASP